MSQELMKLEAPYYVAVFTAVRTDVTEGYDETAANLIELAGKIDGFLGVEFAGTPEFSITLAYWKTMEALEEWKNNPTHIKAKDKGKSTWYDNYRVQICKVETAYGR